MIAGYIRAAVCLLLAFAPVVVAQQSAEEDAVRVFIFAGQSNMVGSDSRAGDIDRFPPFRGLEKAQLGVKFSYCIGRENKMRSDGWVDLEPVDGVVGPELSFARAVVRETGAAVAIIKCAAGGTHLGGDWNPRDPSGFKMYPLALDLVRSSLADLEKQKIPYRVEGVMWHQGENDMFEADYMPNYGRNLEQFIAAWRRDLESPNLRFYIGELCTKTIWGMDLRPRMYAISQGQKSVTTSDPLAEYVPTSHVGVEIGGGVGLHYHYGTLGQLEHGENYSAAYLRALGHGQKSEQRMTWPYKKGEPIKLFILAGHRNMEGERAFVQELESLDGGPALLKENTKIAYRYSIGGGYQKSDGWEPLRPSGFYDTFGPEVSFGRDIQRHVEGRVAIAKFTHSGSQIIDWTPEGSEAKTRNLYPDFIKFVRGSVTGLEAKGHDVELAGIFYHVGENDMSFSPYREKAASRLSEIIEQSRDDLTLPTLRWFVSQQPPTDHESVNEIDVVGAIGRMAQADDNIVHIEASDLSPQEKKLVLNTAGVVRLGEVLAEAWKGSDRSAGE